METRANPNPHGCLARALPDEPIFALLGRDIAAPDTIRRWAQIRLEAGTEIEQVHEALATADAMENWRLAHDGDWRDYKESDVVPTPSDELSSTAARILGHGLPFKSRAWVRSLMLRVGEANTPEEVVEVFEEALGEYFTHARSLAGFVMRADRQPGQNS